MEKIYKEIFELLNKHRDNLAFDVSQLENRAKNHLFGIELKEKHKLDVDPLEIHSTDWQQLHDDIVIAVFGTEHNRTISWSDDKRQPENEVLLLIKFPTGPYIFGDHYPKDLFFRFFDELKEYGPKYTDTNNKCLYFSMDNAHVVYNKYASILKKYRDIDQVNYKRRRIEQMKKELEELEQS